MSSPVPELTDARSTNRWPWLVDLRLLVVIAAANVTSTIAQTMMSFVDFLIVSLLPEASAAQAAVTSGALVFFCFYGLLLGTMICTTTLVSQSLGAGRLRDCSAYAWQGIWLSLILGFAGAALWPAAPGLLKLLGHEPQVWALETEYTRIRLLGMWAAGASVALSHFFIGIHKPWQDTASAVAANVVNLVLTYGMALGHLGFPRMGVAGAAWATVIATVFRLVWLMVALLWGHNAREFNPWATWRWDLDKATRLLRVGLPSGLSFAVDIGAWAAFLTVIVGRFGTAHIAATGIVWRFTELSFMPAVGIGIAVSTTVGKAIGEGRPDLAFRRARLGTVLTTAWMGLIGVICVTHGRWILQRFSHDPLVIQVGVGLFVFAAIYQVFDAVAITHVNALRGAGDTRWPAVVMAFQAWIIMILLGYLTARWFPQWGSAGPWAWATVYIIVVGLTLWRRWKGGRWMQMDVIGRNEPMIPLPAVVPGQGTESAAVGTAGPNTLS